MNIIDWAYISYEKMPEGLNQLNLSEADYRTLKKSDWVVTEKIHGANFGITTDGVEVRFAKRKELLSNHEDFFGYSSQKYFLEEKAQSLFAILHVISKIGRVYNSDEQKKKLVELLLWDVFDSFSDSDYEAGFNQLSPASQKAILDKLEDFAVQLVNNYFEP